MKKKVVSLLIAAAMVTGLLAGCGGKDSSATDSKGADGEVKIQFMHQQVEQERQDMIQAIIDKFEEENPGIKVEQIPVNEDDFDTKIVALGGSGTLPAIIEYNQEQAKKSVTNQFTDLEATDEVINNKGADAFYEGALELMKTEDGEHYSAVPIASWVQGIWVNEKMLQEKGFEAPENWDEVLEIAEAFYDPGSKQYGIALPTGDVAFTEQVFSQYAISNGANVFDKDGGITFDTPEMKEAVEFYKSLASYSMPGSTEVADVKDAFVGGNAPMAMYSTYIINAVIEAGFIDDLSLVLPTNKDEAAYGCVLALGISDGLEDAETEAAKKFVSYMLEDEGNIGWLHMAPGGLQPVVEAISGNEAYESLDAIQKYAHLSDDIAEAVENLQLFGTVDGKNFVAMGDIESAGIISKALNNIIVQGADIDSELSSAQSAIEDIVK